MIRPDTSQVLPLESYDRVVVAFSGGKDSLACILHLLSLGVPADRLVIWHHLIDGAPGSEAFMDWPVTEAYVRAITEALRLHLRYSWRQGGFLTELLRENSYTAPVVAELHDGGLMRKGGVTGKLATRRQFPQVTADLTSRWCSAYLKIDVARRVFANDPAYHTGAFLFVTGERREESPARSQYATVERHASSNAKRRVDQWRAILEWKEAQVWEIIRSQRIQPHPAYRLGWGRLSCCTCIFGGPDQWATARIVAPNQFNQIAAYEREFGKTIHRTKSVVQLADAGTPTASPNDDHELIALAHGRVFPGPVFVDDWTLPRGAFHSAAGPN